MDKVMELMEDLARELKDDELELVISFLLLEMRERVKDDPNQLMVYLAVDNTENAGVM